jgi:RNA-binding protein 8A
MLKSDEDDGSLQSKYTKSLEGWIIFVTNIHPEADEDMLLDHFSECGKVRSLNMNLDRRTGYNKGYAVIEYETYAEAADAVKERNNSILCEQNIAVDFAFIN